jgi:shikimate dehydrogenase
VVQIGTGGAGSAVASALLSSGVSTLHLFDLDPARAAERAAALAALHPDRQVTPATADTLPVQQG